MRDFDDGCSRDYDPITGWVNENPAPHWRERMGYYGSGSSHEDKDPDEKEEPKPSWCQRLWQKICSFFNK